MFRTISVSPLATILLLSTMAAASPQTNEPQMYSPAIYLQVAPANEAAFVEFYKTGAGAKVVRARMQADPDTMGWSLRKAAYAGDPAPQANFVIVAAGKGAPKDPDPAKRDELYRTASGMNYAQYMAKVRTMSEQVGQTMSHIHHRTDNYTSMEGDAVVVTRLKIAEGKSINDLSDFERDFRFPLAAATVKEGGSRGWSFGHMAFPGTALRYDATEAVVYKDLASAMGNRQGAAPAAFAKAFPTKDYVRYVNDRRALSHVVRTDVYRVVVAHRPSH